MLELLRGQKESLVKLCGGLELDLEIYHKAPLEIDVSCFGLDPSGKLSDENYFVFYNQTSSPEQAITLQDGPATGAVRFHLKLDKLPPAIHKLSFTAAIEGTRTLAELERGHVKVLRDQQERARFSYDRTHFKGERAIVICEVYRKGNDWRISAVGRGFNGGLKALVESFGGVVAADGATPAPPAAPVAPPPKATRAKGNRQVPPKGEAIVATLPVHVCARMDGLARQCWGDTDYLAPLYKNMFTALAAYPQVAQGPVQVVFCADASGSMFDLYRNGRVQRIVDKFFAFATTLADGCTMDLWAFGAKCRQFGAVTMDNVREYTFEESGGFERWMSMLNYQINNEPEAMRDITMIYGGRRKAIMVLFLTDGRLHSDWEIEEILIKTSRLPIYWQFVGVHGEEYGILEHLDEIDGRHVENAGFLKMDDIDDLSEPVLFGKLLRNLDDWLQDIRPMDMLE